MYSMIHKKFFCSFIEIEHAILASIGDYKEIRLQLNVEIEQVILASTENFQAIHSTS